VAARTRTERAPLAARAARGYSPRTMNRDLANIAAAIAAVVVLAVGGPWVVGQLRAMPDAGRLAARGSQRVVTLEISGMTCPACAARIHDQLSTTPGVSACEVRVPQARAYVVCDAAVADSSVLAAVHHAGPGYLAAVVRQ